MILRSVYKIDSLSQLFCRLCVVGVFGALRVLKICFLVKNCRPTNYSQ